MTQSPSARVQSLKVSGYRNLGDARLKLPESGVAIVGRNGQGKTNLLEALYYLQLLRSFRGTRDADVVRFGETGFHLSAVVSGTPRGAREISIGFDRHLRRKKVVVNGGPPARLSEAYGTVPSVMCSPDDREIVSGAPSARRRYLDVMLAAVSQKYLFALQQYRLALAQRNAALRELGHRRGEESSLEVWEPALAAHGAAISDARAEWARQRAAEYADLCMAIGEPSSVVLEYVRRDDERDTRAALAQRLEESRAADIRRGTTHHGPHREELRLTLDGHEVRDFASAGQQRTAALALRMLEAVTMRAALGSLPMLLLDDPFAELDRERASRILRLLREIDPGQVVLCVPRADDVPPELSQLEQWCVEDGRIRTG